jgi:poly(A) polymerase
LRGAGYQAYLVGGCVRDLLLRREPVDYDVSTDARPERVQELFPDSIGVGAKFGVVLVTNVSEDHENGDGSASVEVATFRRDIGYSDGRHPDHVVYSSSPEEDVRRRDFTINGLMMDPRSGEVLDFVGGQADLDAGLVRAIGDPALRFAEDKLRMLRAVRFAARFSYAIEPATLAAIRAAAAQISEVSAERIRDELTKLLSEGAAKRGFELLDATGLLSVLLPEIAAMKGVPQPPQYHPEGDVWIHTLLMLEGLPAGVPPTMAWGVLLHDVGKPPTFVSAEASGDRIRFNGHAEVGTLMAGEICGRLRFSRADTEQIEALVANHMKFKDVFRMRPATLKRFVRLPNFDEHLGLHRLDCLSSHRHLAAYNYVREFIRDTPPEEVQPPRLIDGEELKGMGYRPGPIFREILDAVEEAQLDGRIHSAEEALKMIRTAFPLQA